MMDGTALGRSVNDEKHLLFFPFWNQMLWLQTHLSSFKSEILKVENNYYFRPDLLILIKISVI